MIGAFLESANLMSATLDGADLTAATLSHALERHRCDPPAHESEDRSTNE